MRKSLWPSPFRKSDRAAADEEADAKLDDALQRLADATQANTEVCKKVRRRQSSGALKVVNVEPPEGHPI